jgi:purine catabolism regulator
VSVRRRARPQLLEVLIVACLTLGEIIQMAPLRGAGPVVLAGSDQLGAEVRWVHTTELVDIAPLLRGGDLVLSTGIALPDHAPDLAAFAESLHRSEVAGLVIELGRRWTTVPGALITACERLHLPLVSLSREVRFAAVAQTVGERIVDAQLAELQATQRVHEVFTELSVAEAGAAEILDAAQRLSGATVVVEDEHHHVVDYRTGPGGLDEFLAEWPARSRRIDLDGRTSWDATNGWLLTRIGRADRRWGRLVVESPDDPPRRLIAMAERAAAALALHRLHDGHRDSHLRRTHAELLLGLLADPTAPELLQRCEHAGLPTSRRQFVGLALRPAHPDGHRVGTAVAPLDEVLAAVVHSVHEMRLPALVAAVDRNVRVLLSLPSSADAERTTDDLALRIRRRQPAVVGAGRVATRVGELDGTLQESLHVVEAVRPAAEARAVFRLEDVHLRGLLALLAHDDRVRMFVRRELEVLRDHDARSDSGLLEAVRALVRHPGNKSDAAASLHVSRAVFYDRLQRVQRLLGVRLDDPDIQVSLHVALLAEEMWSGTGD